MILFSPKTLQPYSLWCIVELTKITATDSPSAELELERVTWPWPRKSCLPVLCTKHPCWPRFYYPGIPGELSNQRLLASCRKIMGKTRLFSVVLHKRHIKKRHMTKRHMIKRHMTKRHMIKRYMTKRHVLTKRHILIYFLSICSCHNTR